MQFPITRYQLEAAVERYGFRPEQAQQIVADLESEGQIELGGSMLSVRSPTDPGAAALVELCRAARGGSAGSVGAYRIREFLQALGRVPKPRRPRRRK